MFSERDRIEGCSRHYGRVEFPRFCQFQASLGRKYMEIWGSVPHIFVDHLGNNDGWRMREILEKYGLSCRTFTPRPYRYNLSASKDQPQGKWALPYYRECIRAAAALGADKMLVYMPDCLRDESPEKAKGIFVERIRRLADFAAPQNVTFALGGRNAFSPDLPELIKLREEIGLPFIKFFLETENLLYSHYSLKEWLEELKDSLAHIHFTDAAYEGERIIGKGILPMERYLRQIREKEYGGSFSFFFTCFSYELHPFEISREQEEAFKRLKEEVYGNA